MTTLHLVQPTGGAAGAPIGVFDSGVGGLSVLRAIRDELPAEHLVYVADSGYAPYGDRPAGYIEGRTRRIAAFLVGSGAQALALACNTATVVAVASLRGWCPVPVVAIEPAIKPAALATRSGVVGVLATSQTLASDSVARLRERYGAEARILLQACPGLVEQVELGDLAGPETAALVAHYVEPLVAQGADTLVLGCTHYPFLAPLIRAVAGPGVTLIDPAAAVARQLARRLHAHRLEAHPHLPAQPPSAEHAPATPGSERFYTTGDVAQARRVMSTLWGRPVDVQALPDALPNTLPSM